jgi:hypothetical protein
VSFQRRHPLQVRARSPTDEHPGSLDSGTGTRVIGPIRLEDSERLLCALSGIRVTTRNSSIVSTKSPRLVATPALSQTSQPLINVALLPSIERPEPVGQ